MTDPVAPAGPPARPRRVRWGLWHGLMLVVSALFLLPLASMIVGSLRQPGLPPPRGIEWIPQPVAWANYPAVFQLIELGRYLVNTLAVEALAVPVTLLVGSWAGFALAQLPVHTARRIMSATLLILLLPETALWVSRFILYRLTGLLDTPVALIAPSFMATSPIYVLIFYWSYRRVPGEVWEAAQLDGAGALRTWWTIGLPSVRPALAAVSVLTFVYYWREFNDPLLYIQSVEKYTVSLGLAYLEQLDPTNWPILMAGSVLITAPLVAVFLVAQPFFLEALERRRR